MSGHDRNDARALAFALAFPALFFAASYALFGDVGINLGDEGYLWYGVLRTLAGEVPLRDFQAYDPGRYYWCAAFSALTGDGLLGLRAAAMAFGAVGLAFGILVASRSAKSLAELALGALLLGLWMFPTYKLFEPALACTATWFGVRLVERPTAGRHLAAGAFVGLAGVFGRNHAVYAGLAIGLLALLRLWKERPRGGVRDLGALALGVVIGYAPMWIAFLLVPGFGASFLESCRVILREGTNLPFPWRWPWSVPWSRLEGWAFATEAALTLVYLLPCVLLPLGVLRALRCPAQSLSKNLPPAESQQDASWQGAATTRVGGETLGGAAKQPRRVLLSSQAAEDSCSGSQELRARAALVGAAFVGLLYIHHAAVRSYPYHLAQCLPPTLLLGLGLLAGLAPRARRVLHGALALALVLALFPAHPVFSRFHHGRAAEPLLEKTVAGERLRLEPEVKRYLDRLERAMERVPGDAALFVAPNRPLFYALFGKVAPTWWIYFFWKASDAEQAALVADLERRGVDWVFLSEDPIDGREDLLFASTHPLVMAWVQREFEELPIRTAKGDRLFRRD